MDKSFINIAIAIIVLIISLLIKTSKKWHKLIIFVVVLLISSGIFMFLERTVIVFDNLDDAISYAIDGDVEQIVSGEESIYVSYKQDNGIYSYAYFRQTDRGICVVQSFEVVKVSDIADNGFYITYNIRGTDDYYVHYSYYSNDMIEFYDDNGNQIDGNIEGLSTTAYRCHYVGQPNSNYYIKIGEKTIYYYQP